MLSAGYDWLDPDSEVTQSQDVVRNLQSSIFALIVLLG